MNFDERATNAGAAISNRVGSLTPHRSGLIRKRWVAPVGVMVLIVVAVGAASLVGIGRGTTSRVETVAGIDGDILVVDGVNDRLLGGFVSADGAVTILSGDPASPTIQRIRVDAPPPVLDVPTIPKPRWAFGGRVIEYVTRTADGAEVVSVDVPTGRVSTEPYSVQELTSRGIAGLLDFDFGQTHDRTLTLMRASSGPSAIAVGEGSEAKWWVRRTDGGRGRLFDISSLQFLAPGLDSLIVVADGSLWLAGVDRDIQPYAPEGVPAGSVKSAAVGLTGETAFGLMDATVVVETSDGIVSLELGERFGEVGELAWDPDGASIFVRTVDADAGDEALHHCPIADGVCSRVDVDAMGSLVRGSPQRLPPDGVLNVWPGEAVSAGSTNVETWRDDPMFLVTRFTTEVFGWARPIIVDAEKPALLQQQVAFDVRPSAGAPSLRVIVSQTDEQVGWFVSGVQTWSGEFSFKYPFDGSATVGFDRQGAAVVEVTVNVEGIVVSERSTEGGEVELDFGDYRLELADFESPSFEYSELEAYFFILFRGEDGEVFDALLADLGSNLGPNSSIG